MHKLLSIVIFLTTTVFAPQGFTSIPNKYIEFFLDHVAPDEYMDGFMSKEAQLRKFRIETVLRENKFPNTSMDLVEEIFASETMIFHSRNSIWLRSQTPDPSVHPTTLSVAEILELAQERMNLKPKTKDSHCFTCKMKVLTPSGYVPLEQLKVGDEIYSYDEKTNGLVKNRVKLIHRASQQSYGRLEALPGLQSVEVTSSHPFRVGSSGEYTPIGQTTDTTSLLSVSGISANKCEVLLKARGQYIENIGKGLVMTLELELAPHNFILEGFVVHNKLTKV